MTNRRFILKTIFRRVDFGETRTYSLGHGFYADVVKENKRESNANPCYSIWLYHENVGIKEYVYGILVKEASFRQIKNNLYADLYEEGVINNYYNQYMSNEENLQN